MKKIFTLFVAMLCAWSQVRADKVTGSSTLPADGRPEHVYTMENANGLVVGRSTSPTQTEANVAEFAFYAVDGVTNGYRIYNRSNEMWLTYATAAAYSSGTGFVSFTGEQSAAAYFIVDNYSGDYYQISPVTSQGAASLYLNYFGGVGSNPYDGDVTLGLWSDNGSADAGSRWIFTERVVRVYTLALPDGVTATIEGAEYANGDQLTAEGSIDKSAVAVTVPEGSFAVVSVDDVNNTIAVNFATLPVQPSTLPYTNAWVYPKQQDNVGAASLVEDNGVYTFSNNVLAACYMRVGDALYFAGSDAMNLVAGTELFTVGFGAGDNVPASAMTLNSVAVESLAANSDATGGAEHFAGKQLVANYSYTYNEQDIAIVWRAVLRDGSHYLRTEMELTGVDDVDMYDVIPMIYNVDTDAAGSTPAVVGNTRGAVLMSNKIFAGLDTPTAYNTVGEATGADDAWTLAEALSPVALSASSWVQVSADDVPGRVTEATGAGYPNIYAYTMADVTLKENQKVEVTVEYTSGNHRLNFGGADLVDAAGGVAANDYHSGYSGTAAENNTFTFTAPYDGTFSIRVFVENLTETITASSTMSVNIYEAKEGVVVNTSIVGIQGRWSRNTTLAAGETWKVGSVVGLVAQDGKQAESNIRDTQKRRSFLAYSERERAVPWRAFPAYISWYELNINRNNAAPGSEHTNMTADQVLDVLTHWRSDFYDKYGVGPAAFVIDDGWDNYGPWTFHSGFPNEMRDIASAAKEMGASVGAWLGPVGGYGQSGNYRRSYWAEKGGMALSNPLYYQTFKDAAYNLVKNQGDNYQFFKYDGISAQFSATGPDAGDTGNENAEGIIRLERYVREELREDIFFNTTVGTWASPFWYQITDATWRQENDYGEAGNNSIDREKWITYRDRLVYQNYVTNSPICPINTLMTHGFILTQYGAVSKDMSYEAVLRELRCAFVCGSGLVELYNDYALMNSINDGKLWEDLAECIAWQKKNSDVLPDAHWVGGNPWTGSTHEVYGWASWNGGKATLALRNGGNSAQTYTFTLREALEIPANISGEFILNKSFKVQDALEGLTENVAIDIDTEITVTLPANSVFAFDGINADPSLVPFQLISTTPAKGVEALSAVALTFNMDVTVDEAVAAGDYVSLTAADGVAAASVASCVANGNVVTVTLEDAVVAPGEYTMAVAEGLIKRAVDNMPYSGECSFTVVAPTAIEVVGVTPSGASASLSTITLTFNKDIIGEYSTESTNVIELKNPADAVVSTATYTVEGRTLTVVLNRTITAMGEYTLVIPEGIVSGAALGDAFSGVYSFTVDPYIPRNSGVKTNTGRNITQIGLSGSVNGESSYSLSDDEQTMDYVDATDAVTFTVEAGEELTPSLTGAGTWINAYVYVDADCDGFTASVAGDGYTPAGDLVAYSFYNNDNSSDASGWNSVGTAISGNNRSSRVMPAFNAPATPGLYRMRFKQDWCNIDPLGDADGKFGDFKANGGQIVDIMLEVVESTAIEDVTGDNAGVKAIYDLTGRKLDGATVPGVYIINGKKIVF